VLIVTFYAFVEALARRRGFNPDTPPHLRKVTETI
jgi:glucosamine--fructose-6-phosphate aminotransferase (isomerizing)